MSCSQILHFKRQLRVLHFLEPLKSQTALSNLNHPGSSPAPQTYAAHYISTEIYCNLAQQSLWSPRELICTPARQGVSPGQLACGRKAEIYPEATGAWVWFCFSEYREIPRIHPTMKGCIPRLSLCWGCFWAREGPQHGAHHGVPQAEAPCAALNRAGRRVADALCPHSCGFHVLGSTDPSQKVMDGSLPQLSRKKYIRHQSLDEDGQASLFM